MRATLLLCDAAQVADGKLYVLGWGWNVTGPDPAPMALAVKFDIAGAEIGTPHHWELVLEDEDGQPVLISLPDEVDQPIEVRGDFDVPRAAEVAAGGSVSVPIALYFGPIPLPPGGRYTWRLIIDGESDTEWRASFSTRPTPEAE